MVSLWPLLYSHNAWVGTANPLCGTIKISKGKHIRDARVLARGFAVTTFVSEHAWVGLFKCSRRFGAEINRMDMPTLTGSMRIALANLLATVQMAANVPYRPEKYNNGSPASVVAASTMPTTIA
jgi:hypothetical protein